MNDHTPFLILSAGRTGSNLLRDLIGSHPHAFCGGEVFNKEFVAREGIPWPVGDVQHNAELLQLMHNDPAQYVERLFEVASRAGYFAIGGKLTYENAAAHPAAADCLAANPRVRVIHLRRRNVLRQYLSLQRAFKTGQWMAKGDGGPPPPVHIDFVQCVWFLLRNDELQNRFAKVFTQHETMNLTYEELAVDPVGVGRRVVAFLELDPDVPLQIRHKKSATDLLRQAILNYDELKARFGEWAGFFDE